MPLHYSKIDTRCKSFSPEFYRHRKTDLIDEQQTMVWHDFGNDKVVTSGDKMLFLAILMIHIFSTDDAKERGEDDESF